MRWASSESATLYSSSADCVCEVSAIAMTGSSFGLAFWNIGEPSPEGRSACAALMAVCTSSAAESMSTPLWKIMNTSELPSELDERIWSTPGSWPRWRSSGAVTVEAMVVASAPDWLACTKITGIWMFGNADTPSFR